MQGLQAVGGILAIGVAAAAALGLGQPVTAAVWQEISDAPQLPDTAQETSTEDGVLSGISGSLFFESDVDLYAILVSDPAEFAVSVSSVDFAGVGGDTPNDDATLYVFDDSGRFAFENQDEGPGLLPQIFPGDFAEKPAGLYYLGFTTFNNRPGQLVNPLTSWILDPAPRQQGTYSLALAGAAPVRLPEAAGSAAALAALGALARRGRR